MCCRQLASRENRPVSFRQTASAIKSDVSPLNPPSWAQSGSRAPSCASSTLTFVYCDVSHLRHTACLVYCQSTSVGSTVWHFESMADGPEADVDDPPSIHFPPLITVSDLPGATAAGNHGSVKRDDSSTLSGGRARVSEGCIINNQWARQQ